MKTQFLPLKVVIVIVLVEKNRKYGRHVSIYETAFAIAKGFDKLSMF